MSLEKRTPDVPRCGSELPKALCIFQWITSWALDGVASTPMDNTDANMTQNFETELDIFSPSRVGKKIIAICAISVKKLCCFVPAALQQLLCVALNWGEATGRARWFSLARCDPGAAALP